jgi:hypothetical protein
MAGADGVQIASALLEHGPDFLTRRRDGFEQWATRTGTNRSAKYAGARGARNQSTASERGNHIRMLESERWTATRCFRSTNRAEICD